MEVLLIVVVGALNIVCFFVGAKVGQQVSRGEEIKLPEVNPMQVIRERQDKKAAEYEQSKFDTVMRNIEVYDGTEYGQTDVPRG